MRLPQNSETIQPLQREWSHYYRGKFIRPSRPLTFFFDLCICHISISIFLKIKCYTLHSPGDMWAQDWANLLPELTPYPNSTNVDVTDALVEQVPSV